MARGQSALEYMVTYGWAILAIVVVAALLWAMGIFDPSGLVGTGNKASGFSFKILDQKYEGTALTLSVANTQGRQVNITDVKVGVVGSGTITGLYRVLNAGVSASIVITGVPTCGVTGTAGEKYADVGVVITYGVTGGIGGHTDLGTISGVCA